MPHPRSQLFCLPLLLCAGAAFAGPRAPQVVVLESRVQGEGTISAEERARASDAVWAALDRLGVRRVPDTDREAVLAGETGLRACLDRADCLERLGRLLEATHVLGVTLTHTAPTAYAVQVRLFDVEVGEDGASQAWECTACDMDKVGRQLDAMVEAAVQKSDGRPRATLVVRSAPPNADVQLDGRRIGFTELERAVFAGPHDLVVSAPGLAPEHMHIDVSAGQRLELALAPGERARVAPPPPQPVVQVIRDKDDDHPQKVSRWKLGLGIPLLVIGAAGAGLGGASLALDGTCAGAMPCTRFYDTRVPGIAEVAAGGALVVAGVVLIIADGVQQRRLHRRRSE